MTPLNLDCSHNIGLDPCGYVVRFVKATVSAGFWAERLVFRQMLILGQSPQYIANKILVWQIQGYEA